MQNYLKKLEMFNKYFHWLKPEAIEQSRFVLHLEKNWYTYTAIPNSTYTKWWKQKIINMITWLKPWLCDMLVVLKRGSLLFIEMKLPRKVLKNGSLWASPSTVSEEQKKWIEILGNIDNVMAEISYGCDHAIELVDQYEKIE